MKRDLNVFSARVAVDGSEIWLSPVEGKVVHPIIYRVLAPSKRCLVGTSSIKSIFGCSFETVDVIIVRKTGGNFWKKIELNTTKNLPSRYWLKN